MGPAYYVISILGCADGSAQCVPAATMPAHFESEATCLKAQADALVANSDLDFPSLVARCTAVSPRPASAQEEVERTVVVAIRS